MAVQQVVQWVVKTVDKIDKVMTMSEQDSPIAGRWYSGLLVAVFTLLIGYNLYRLGQVQEAWVWRQWLTVAATVALAWLLWKEIKRWLSRV